MSAGRPGCRACHFPDAETPIGLRQGGLDLSSHATLLAGGTNSGGSIVVPGRPCESVLFLKVAGAPPFGARMPQDGPPFLDAVAVGRIHDWIAEGASDN